MQFEDLKLKIDNLPYEFDKPSHTKLKSFISEQEYNVIIYHLKNMSCAIYEFEDEQGSDEYFKNWSNYYHEISKTKYEEYPNLKYSKCEQQLLNNGYYNIVIKHGKLVLFATELWQNKEKLEKLLLDINYLK